MKMPSLKNDECIQMLIAPKTDIWILSHEFSAGRPSEKNFVFSGIRTTGGEVIEISNQEIQIKIDEFWYPARICNVNINVERRFMDVPESEMEFAKKIAPFMIQCSNGLIKNLGKKKSSGKKHKSPKKIDPASAEKLLYKAEILRIDTNQNEWRFV